MDYLSIVGRERLKFCCKMRKFPCFATKTRVATGFLLPLTVIFIMTMKKLKF